MPEVIIIGGGFSGLCMAIQLKRKLGMQDFLLFEKAAALGGVWANQVYPGVQCDVPTALYSLSFGQRYWKNLFSDGATIQSYLHRLADEYHILDSNAMLLSEVVEATWNAMTKHWSVTVMHNSSTFGSRMATYTCKVLLCAVGNMSVPKVLLVQGKECFEGSILHAGRFDHKVDIRNKNVVLVGSGCTATQIASAIAPHVKSLHIFAPTKQWFLPRPVLPMASLFDFLAKYSKLGRLLLRCSIWAVGESGHRAMHWSSGKDYRKGQESISRDYVLSHAPAKYRSELTPDFAFGARRPIFDVQYLQTLHRSNVTLYAEYMASLTRSRVLRLTGESIAADIIIAATGYQAKRFLESMRITGQDGLDLHGHASRRGGLSCYKGSFFSKFPNFATIHGPNSGTAHNTAVFMIECQVAMIMKRLVEPVLQQEDVDSIVIKQEKEDEWMTWLRKELKETVWEKENKGWYTDEHGLCVANYPRSQLHFWWTTFMTSSRDFVHDPRDFSKDTYGSIKEFETFAGVTVVFLFVLLVSMTMSPVW